MAVTTGPRGGVSVRRLAVDWQTWGLWAALLVGIGLELLTPGTPLAAFLLVPVVASAALGRPDLTAALTVASLLYAIPELMWLDHDDGEIVRRSLLILGAGVVGFAVAVTLARATRARDQALAQARDSAALLRTVSDAMLDPQILLEPVRDGSGHITDFTYADVNRAACEHLGVAREDFIGQSLAATFPNIEQSGLLAQYVRCAQTGEPVALDGFLFFNGILGTALRYDIRGARTPQGRLSMTYQDVTDRFEVQQRLATSEEQYRLLAENSADIVCHVRDGRLVWVSPSIEAVLGAPPEFWLGQEVFDFAPPEDLAEQSALMAKVNGGEAVKHRVRAIGVDGVTHWFDLRAQPFYDTDGNHDGLTTALRLVDDEVAAERRIEQARLEQARADALYRRSVDSAAVGMCLTTPEGRFTDVNQAMCEFFGYDTQSLLTKTWQELTAEDYLQADLDKVADMVAGRIESYRTTKQFIHADGHPIWGELAASCLRDADGQVEVFIGQITDITAEVHAREQLEQARRDKERDDERYRRSIDNAAVGMCMVTPEGRVTQINDALCRFFGLTPEVAIGTRWQDVTEPEYLEEEQSYWNGILEGRINSYRMVKHYQRADGRVIWGDVSVSGIRDDNGKLDYLITLIADVTAEIEARDQLAVSERSNRALAQSLESELRSAAKYVRAVLADDLAGQVSVSSRYLPSSTLGGDFFDFRWIDEDHLMVYVLDVSGHGVESALVAVSLRNLMRSASLSVETLLQPDQLLATLNNQFDMERHDGNFFTMFYGVYEVSTGTLRYAGGGHPPALLITDGQITRLDSHGPPLGTLEDAAFPAETLPLQPGAELLLYTDGAYELPLDNGGQWSLGEFADLCTRLTGTPDWSLDDIIVNLRRRSATGGFTDDCCLVRLTVQ